jgi:hypothetical protein
LQETKVFVCLILAGEPAKHAVSEPSQSPKYIIFFVSYLMLMILSVLFGYRDEMTCLAAAVIKYMD